MIRPSRALWGASALLVSLSMIVWAGGYIAFAHEPGAEHAHDAGHAQEPGHDHTDEADHPHDHDDATARHRFEDAEAWAAQFEDPARDEWQLPDRVVETLIDREDLVIADIGSATGYFPVRFAHASPRGLVFGADIEPGMVWYLNDRARAEGLSNLISILAAPDDPHLPQPVDLVFICNTYHHIDDRMDYLDRLRVQLRPGARVAIVDFRQSSPRGPDHKLDPEVVQEEFLRAGYTFEARHDFLPDQYFLVYSAPKE